MAVSSVGSAAVAAQNVSLTRAQSDASSQASQYAQKAGRSELGQAEQAEQVVQTANTASRIPSGGGLDVYA